MRARALSLGLAAGLVGLAGLSGCSDDAVGSPAPPAAEVKVAAAPKDLGTVKIGVLVSVNAPADQGGDYTDGPATGKAASPAAAAAGAWLAAYRSRLAGTDVQLVVRSDAGRSATALKAVQDMVSERVSGIVVATRGSHLEDALASASTAGVPVVAPYLEDDALPSGVYATGPTRDQVTGAVEEALQQAGRSKPLVLSDDSPLRLDGAVGVAALDRYERQVRAAQSRARRGGSQATVAPAFDSVVITGSAASDASLLARVQTGVAQAASLPIILGPEALTPAFTLAVQGGRASGASGSAGRSEPTASMSGRLSAVGTDATDATTLRADASGDAAAGFFAALRLALGGSQIPDDDVLGPFAEFGRGADTASHDAVLALLAAVRAAGSTAPAEVASALAGSTPGSADGLAGPALDFGDASALPDDAVSLLSPTTQDPGVRPVAQDADGTSLPGVFWFASTKQG